MCVCVCVSVCVFTEGSCRVSLWYFSLCCGAESLCKQLSHTHTHTHTHPPTHTHTHTHNTHTHTPQHTTQHTRPHTQTHTHTHTPTHSHPCHHMPLMSHEVTLPHTGWAACYTLTSLVHSSFSQPSKTLTVPLLSY